MNNKTETANQELIAFEWMTKNGYDRKASKDIAPILIKFSSQLHDELIEKVGIYVDTISKQDDIIKDIQSELSKQKELVEVHKAEVKRLEHVEEVLKNSQLDYQKKWGDSKEEVSRLKKEIKQQESHIDFCNQQFEAENKKAKQLQSELSKQKEEIEFLKKVRIDQNDTICKLDSDLTQQKELVEEQKEIIDVSNRVGIDLVKKNGELESTIESQSLRIKELEEGIKIILGSRDCYSEKFGVEIPEEISAQFALNLNEANQIYKTLSTPTTEPKEVKEDKCKCECPCHKDPSAIHLVPCCKNGYI